VHYIEVMGGAVGKFESLKLAAIDVRAFLDLHSRNATTQQIQQIDKIREYLRVLENLKVKIPFELVLTEIFDNMISDKGSDFFIALMFYSYFPGVFFGVAKRAIHDRNLDFDNAFTTYVPPDPRNTLEICVKAMSKETGKDRDKIQNFKISSLLGISSNKSTEEIKKDIENAKSILQRRNENLGTSSAFLQKRQLATPNLPSPLDSSSPKLLTQQTVRNSLSQRLLQKTQQAQQTEQTGHAVMSLYMLSACAVFFFVLMKLRK